MIKAVIFDLDGTLVETEHLKAMSYAKAALELCSSCATEEEVINAFKELVGRSRHEVAQALVERFRLAEAARARMAEFGVSTPWQAYVQIRLRIFDTMMADPETIKESRCPEAIAILEETRRLGLRTALTTTSTCKATTHILRVLDLGKEFEFKATADDVEHTKPDPEIYFLTLRHLDVPPKECVALEDSLPGVQAASAAEVWCIAVPTSFTRDAVEKAKILDPKWIVDEPLESVFKRMLAERAKD